MTRRKNRFSGNTQSAKPDSTASTSSPQKLPDYAKRIREAAEAVDKERVGADLDALLDYISRLSDFIKIQSDLRHMELNGKGLSDVWKIPSRDVQQLQHLRVLKLVGFKEVGKLLDQLGNLPNGLQELIISYCSSVQELSESISNFPGLRILRISYCSNLSMLTEGLTSLKYLRELDIEGCESLKVSLGVLQWKRVILNEKGCQNLRMYLRSLDVLSLNEEDCESCESVPVYVDSLDRSQWKTTLLSDFDEEEGCESVPVYVDSLDRSQWKTLLFDFDEEEGCESVPVYVDSLDRSQWGALVSNIVEEIQ